jgi:tetratricopeptide (TPR) repeat protein
VRANADHEERHAEDLEGAARAAHLAACVECALLQRMTSDAARADEGAQAGAAPLSAGALDAILAAAALPAPVVPLPVRRRRWPWAALAFAAALALALVAVAAGRFAEHRAPAPPAKAPPAIAPAASPSAASAEPPAASSAAPAEPPPPPSPSAAPRPLPAPSASAARTAEPEAPTETAAVLFARANEARRGGRGAEALRLYDELGARFPGSREDTAARVTSGWLLLEQLGQPAAALARFDRYLAASGGGTLAQEAMAGRALALGKLGRRADELAAWRRLLEIAPGSAYAPRARERLGQADAPSPAASSAR